MGAPDKLAVQTPDGTDLDVDAYVPDAGDTVAADAVILCHGIIQNAQAFAVPSFSVPALLNARGFVVYAVNMRGRDGQSARHDFATYVDEDAAAVVDAVAARHRSVSWVGHSMGGLIGCALPRALAAVVALGSPLFPGSEALRRWAFDRRLFQLARRLGGVGRAFPGRLYAKAFVAARRALDTGRVPNPMALWKPGSFLDDDDLAHTLQNAFADDGHHVLADLCELGFTNGTRAGRLPYSERLAALKSPLLCVAGAHDALAPPDSVHALFSRAGSPVKQFVEVDAGHIDLVLGSRARADVWGPVVTFIEEQRTRARAVAAVTAPAVPERRPAGR